MSELKWSVTFSKRAAKQIKKLAQSVQAMILLLARDLGLNGPTTRGSWKNYAKLRGLGADQYHCHLVKGRPTYVCCWKVKDKQLKIIEVYSVGTHEKAPY